MHHHWPPLRIQIRSGPNAIKRNLRENTLDVSSCTSTEEVCDVWQHLTDNASPGVSKVVEVEPGM